MLYSNFSQIIALGIDIVSYFKVINSAEGVIKDKKEIIKFVENNNERWRER